jgi:hypothetical protein
MAGAGLGGHVGLLGLCPDAFHGKTAPVRGKALAGKKARPAWCGHRTYTPLDTAPETWYNGEVKSTCTQQPRTTMRRYSGWAAGGP